MTIDEFNTYINSIPENISTVVPEIVAETATEYYKEAFSKKAFDRNPWVPAKKLKSKGSLLVNSGNLMNSIRPSEINPHRVVISAGNDHVHYAKAHNEGSNETITVPAHNRLKKGKSKKTNDSDTVFVKQHTRKQNIPQRQFIAQSKELNDIIKQRIDDFIDSIL